MHDGGSISYILTSITVGLSNALDLLMSGRVIQGEEAYRMGLVNFLVDTQEELLDKIMEYASYKCRLSSPAAMATIKQQP